MESIYTHHAVLLLPAEFRVAANDAMQANGAEGETFVDARGASPTGTTPCTVLFAGVQMTDEQFAACQQIAAAHFPGGVVLGATPGTALSVLEQALDTRGLVMVEVL